MYFEGNRKLPKAGLRFNKHVRANRIGPTMHQFVTTASGMPLGLCWELKRDTTASCTKRLLKRQFAPMQGGAEDAIEGLDKVKFKGDRAYMIPSVAQHTMVKAGVDVDGTYAMTLYNCYVWKGKVNERDKRTRLEMLGAKTMYIKETVMHSRKVYVIAYRNGIGNIISGFSTTCGSYDWTFVPFRYRDFRDWYDEWHRETQRQYYEEDYDEVDEECMNLLNHQMFRRCFTSVDMKHPITDEFLRRLKRCGVSPLTVRQGTSDWFFIRCFSLTSRSSYHVIVVACKSNKNDLRVLLATMGDEEFSKCWDDLQVIREYLGVESEGDDDIDEGDDNTGTSAAGSWTIDDIASIEDTAQIINQIDEVYIPLIEVATNIGMSMSRATTQDNRTKNNKKQLRKWLKAPKQMRRAYFDRDSLKEDCVRLGFKSKDWGIHVCRNLLSDHYKQPVNKNDPEIFVSTKSSKSSPKEGFALGDKMLHCLLSSSYLPRLTGKGREWASRGLELELPLVTKMTSEVNGSHEMCCESLTEINIREICHAPLVGKAMNSGSGNFFPDLL